MAPPAVLLVLPILASMLLHRAHGNCELATCGNLTVKYPFWLGAPSQTPPEPSCGPPPFELWCSGNGTNTTSASIRGSAIHVLSIDYAAGTFVASHTRVAAAGDEGVCRTDFNMSSSLALSPFRISATNRAMCFLYNCNGTNPRGDELVNATGRCSRPIYAYLGGSYDRDTPPAVDAGSCTYAYLPVLGSEAATETAANYSVLLKAGFLLEWGSAGIGDCGACPASGGECRYSNASAAFACLCPSGAGGTKLMRGSTCYEPVQQWRCQPIVATCSSSSSLSSSPASWPRSRRSQTPPPRRPAARRTVVATPWISGTHSGSTAATATQTALPTPHPTAGTRACGSSATATHPCCASHRETTR